MDRARAKTVLISKNRLERYLMGAWAAGAEPQMVFIERQ